MTSAGVLALQGDVSEHLRALHRLGVDARRVRRARDLAQLDGLVLPGGESTTIGRLASEAGLVAPIREFAASGRPLWGTCAGLVLLADEVAGEAPVVGGLDIAVRRNAFGRQVDSFETDLVIAGIGPEPFRAVFIRAPSVLRAGDAVDVLARLDDGTIVAVRQGNILGTAFHPELTADPRLHELFVRSVEGGRAPGRSFKA